MSFSISETRWIKSGKAHNFVFIGKEIVATASGIYVSFLNLNTRERRIERFDNKERGDGASCLAGHPVVSMFSVAERKLNPKITIFIYPTLHKISTCVLVGNINGYLSCSFAGTEYLVSLTSFPEFRLIVWLWKIGTQVATLETKINDLVQDICCSSNFPHLISQHGVVGNTLSIYQVRTCSKIVSVHHVDAPLPERGVVSLSWTAEGNVFVSDELGNVWLIAIESGKLYSVVQSRTRLQTPKNKSITVAYKIGVIVANADNKIAFYKRSSADWKLSWQIVWSISISGPIRIGKQHCSKNGILFHSENGEIFEIITQQNNDPHIEVICADEIKYKALVSISQRTNHVAAIDRLDRLCIVELSTGKLDARLSLNHHGKVLQIESHPVLPILALCSDTGNCILINVASISSLKILKCFHLHGDCLDIMKFSLYGRTLGIGNSQIGILFVIGKQFRQKEVDVLGYVEIDGYIADFLIHERSNDNFEILVLAANPSIASLGGNKVIVYTCEIANDFCASVTCVIDLPEPFEMLGHEPNKPLNILGIPSLSKQIFQMELQNNFQDIVLTTAVSSIHQMRKIGIHATDSHVITYGYDGLIVIRSSAELRKAIAIFMPHHRREGGVKKCAVSSRFGEIIVSLGRNGDLVATQIRLPEVKMKTVENETVKVSKDDFAFDPNELYDLKEETWLSSVVAAKLKNMHDKALLLRTSVLIDLEKIKTRIRELLDMNESESPDDRLPISAFDLDREFRQRRVEEAKLERNKVRRDLEEECARRDLIASYLRKMFWESLQVKPGVLKSIGDNTTVRNYPLIETNLRLNDFEVWNKLSSEAAEFLYSCEIHEEKEERTLIYFDEESLATSNNKNKVHKIAQTWYNLANEVEKLYISGVTTFKWIEDESVILTHQLLASCDDRLENILKKDTVIEDRERKLKMYFNDLFEEMRCTKERELKCAKERIDRLRHCTFELKTIYGIDYFLEPIETPTWYVDEIPDYVVTVKDCEVFEKQVNKNRDDKEKHKKTSNFYIKALKKMMNGVLEPKWEDEVKKTVSIPRCLITKEPSKYTVEDIAIIVLYKFKLQALRKKRKKYKALLQAEIAEIKEALQRDIATFNDKMKDLELTKIQIECAILQERLLRIRAIQRHRTEVGGKQEIVRFAVEKVEPATQKARKLAEICTSLEVIVSELKSRYENLCKAEKRQETKFRGEFEDLKQPMVEHLLRHYKKRPRSSRLTTTSVIYLTEVAKCVTGCEKSDILPRECLDFLKDMDALDVMPGNLPSQITVNYWRTMCKLRRAKIEVETKVRCCAIEVAEAEQTLSFYQKTICSIDNVVANKELSLDKKKNSLAQFAEDMEIQLVLRMDQIEIQLQGSPVDSADAVLITREELLCVNDRITDAGRSKLSAMYESMHLRKILSHHEWQQSCARMTWKDLKQELKDVQKFKITRNVLELLNCHSFGANLNEDYETMQTSLQTFRDRFRQLLELEQTRLKETKRLMTKWRKKTDKIARDIGSKQSDFEENRKLINDLSRKDEESRRIKLTAIARRTKLVIKLEENYEQLLALHARLEVLKLRTYPTLQFNKSIFT